MSAGLARLAIRRALAPGVIAILAATLVLVLRADWGGGNAELAVEAGEHASAFARASTREAVWSIVVLAVLPLLALRAARIVRAWRSGEGDWLGSRATGRASILVSTWLGTWIGGTILLAAAAVAVEIAAGSVGSFGSFASPAPALRRAGEIALPPAAWITEGSPATWTAAPRESAWPAGSRARIELAFGAGTGSSAEVILRARRDVGDPRAQRDGGERTASARIASRGAVEVEIPEGEGPLSFEISCSRPGARAFVVSDAMEVWEPGARETSAGVEILLRLVLALGAWSALAIGLGAWLSAPTAVLLLLAAWIPAWLADRPPPWLPAGDLWNALAISGSGRVPHAMDARALLAFAALAAAGLAAGIAGLRSWRAAP